MKNIIVFISLLITISGYSQIKLVNSGFEDQPSDATVPKGWLPCEDFTTPDILPGFWGEYNEASQGDTYVGLITRDNSTFESIGQRLPEILKKGQCYSFRIDLARGGVYAGFNKPLKLRIWLGINKCDKGQMIYLTKEISHTDWKTYEVNFTPDKDYQYIRMEAHHKDGNFSYKGNVLLDNMSALYKCNRV